MTKYIAAIEWPASPTAARHLLLSCMVTMLDELCIGFPPGPAEPMALTRRFLAGESGEALERERDEANEHWWARIGELGIRDFSNPRALNARLAICLLVSDEAEKWGWGEQLGWFLEVLGFLGEDYNAAYEVAEKHFSFGAWPRDLAS